VLLKVRYAVVLNIVALCHAWVGNWTREGQRGSGKGVAMQMVRVVETEVERLTWANASSDPLHVIGFKLWVSWRP
jgi:hypothetical protein